MVRAEPAGSGLLCSASPREFSVAADRSFQISGDSTLEADREGSGGPGGTGGASGGGRIRRWRDPHRPEYDSGCESGGGRTGRSRRPGRYRRFRVPALYLVFPFPPVSQPGVAGIRRSSRIGVRRWNQGDRRDHCLDCTLNANIAQGGQGGTGGHGGTGPLAELGNGSLSIGTGTPTGGGTPTTGGGGGGTALTQRGPVVTKWKWSDGGRAGACMFRAGPSPWSTPRLLPTRPMRAVDRPAKGARPARASSREVPISRLARRFPGRRDLGRRWCRHP